jgi:hypothetical protein
MAFAAVGGVVLGLWRGILQPVDRGGLWWIVGDDGTSLLCSIRSMRKAVGSVRVLSIIITSEQQTRPVRGEKQQVKIQVGLGGEIYLFLSTIHDKC